jgi:hypothetical protein
MMREEINIEENFTHALLRSPLFKSIDSEELPGMLHCLQPREVTYRKGNFIATAGAPLEGIGVILGGRAAVIKESAGGDRVVMSILKPGDLFRRNRRLYRKAAVAGHGAGPGSRGGNLPAAGENCGKLRPELQAALRSNQQHAADRFGESADAESKSKLPHHKEHARADQRLPAGSVPAGEKEHLYPPF